MQTLTLSYALAANMVSVLIYLLLDIFTE